VNRTKQLKSEIVSVELLPEIIRSVLGHLEEDTVSAILKNLVSIREEYPRLRLAAARTCDEDGNMIAAAYLCEYPGALGVLVGPWNACSEGNSNQDIAGIQQYSIDEPRGGTTDSSMRPLSEDATVSTLKLLLDVSKEWKVELVQSLDHRNCEGEASSRNVVLRNRLEASGMKWLTTLQHLQLELGSASLRSVLDSYSSDLMASYSWTRFRWRDESRWCDWLDGTYIDSMDCPELNGIRSTSMTLQGYWALTGVPTEHAFLAGAECDESSSDRGRSRTDSKEQTIEWWGLRTLVPTQTRQSDSHAEISLDYNDNDGPIEAGFMLSQTSQDSWELTYMGVHRRFRGNRLGKACLAKAIERVARWNGTRISLAVDVRNHVCKELYIAFGFRPASEIDAWIYNPSQNDTRKS
jgi:ribosomal protein S18 acetylase RimI-like enzyme